MSAKMDLSLDDIIKTTKGGGRGGGRGRGRGRGVSGARNSGGLTRGIRTGGGPRRGALRSAAAFRPRSGNPDGVWSHDKFQDATFGGARRSGGLRTSGGGGAGGASKITISNLHFGVTDADIIELFGELGTIRYASVHYDRSGRSMGKADVLFERRASAQQAIQKYNGIPLDGRAMDIVWANAAPATSPVPAVPRSLNRVSGGRVARNTGAVVARGGLKGARGGARGGRGGGRGRGGRTQTKTPTAAELDAELDAYVSEKQQ